MSRITRRTVTLLSVALMFAAVVSVPAQAKPFHVTGQQTTINPSSQATQFLSAHQITVTALAPATISGGALTLPITGGFVSHTGREGLLRHAGAVKFSKGSRSLVLRHFVLFGNAHHAWLSARSGGDRFVLARLSDVTRTISGKTGTISGELKLTVAGARRINHRLGRHLVSAGADLGSLTSTVTVA